MGISSFPVTTPQAIQTNPVQGTPISSLINAAQGIQSLQQAQQLNPLQLEQAKQLLEQSKIGTEKAKRTLEPEVSAKESEAKRLAIEAEKSGIDAKFHYANQARGVYGGLVTDPDFINGNSEKMVEKLNKARDHLEDVGIPMHGSRMHDQLIEQAKKDPAQAYQSLIQGLNIAGGAGNQFGQVAGAQNLPIYQGAGGQPGQPVQTMQPGQPMQPAAPSQLPGVQPAQMNMPVESQPVAPAYPVRIPGRPAPAPLPQEVADTTAGSAYRNSLVNRQINLTTDKRNIEEVKRLAKEIEENAIFPTSGVLGSAERNVSTFLGTEQGVTYKELGKRLANAALSNMTALGGDTNSVEALRLKQLANGDVTYPPKVLIDIANSTAADVTNLDMQATGAQNYAKRFGDNNLKSFQQMWSKNADSKVFEIINTAKDPYLTKQEKQQKTNELLGITSKMSPKEQQEIRNQFNRKYQNLQKLTQDGTL